MSLVQWKANGWLKDHATSSGELCNLLSIADRDIADTNYVDGASAAEAEELLEFAESLRNDVMNALLPKYPTLGQQNETGKS